MNSRARDSRAMDSRTMRDITSYCEHFLECFGKFLNTFLCMYTHFTISSRLTCIPMALPVPQNGPACPSKWPKSQCGNFFNIKKGFYCESFLECFLSVYTHFYTCTLILLSLEGLYT